MSINGAIKEALDIFGDPVVFGFYAEEVCLAPQTSTSNYPAPSDNRRYLLCVQL